MKSSKAVVLGGVLVVLAGVAVWQVRSYLREIGPPEPPPDIERFEADAERLARLRAAALPSTPAAAAADWPQWRGPNRDGISGQKIQPWPEDGPRRAWSVPGGPGHSGLSIAGGRVFTMVQDGDDEVVLCLDAATGKRLWRHAYRAKFDESSAGPGPHATPTVADGRVYTVGATGKFSCLDAATGIPAWQRDLMKEFGAKVPQYGVSCSPLVDGDRVVIVQGPAAAFDRKDGRPIWKSGDDRPGHSSPVAATLGGRKQLVVLTGQSLSGLAPEDGGRLWGFPWETQGDFNIATPIVAGDYVFVSSGYGKGCALVEVSQGSARAVYEHNRMRNTFATSVVHGDHLYGFDEILFACMEFRSGKMKWKQRGFGKGNVLRADGRLVVLGEEGKLALVEPSPEGYRELAASRVSKTRCWAPPSLAMGKLFFRDQESIVCLDLESPR